MGGLYAADAFKVCDGAGDLEDAGIRPNTL